MNFADRTLFQLATAAGRDTLFGQEALGEVVSAAFDTDASPVTGPFALDVERCDIGVEVSRTVNLQGQFSLSPGAVPGEVRALVTNLRIGSPLRIDALWRGQLIVRSVAQDDRVAAVMGGFSMLDMDREIIAALGALPTDPSALEVARRKLLLNRLKVNAAQPDVIDDGMLDTMLAAVSEQGVSGLLAERGNTDVGRFRITFTAPVQNAVPVPIRLPVTLAVQVFDTLSGLAAMLADSRSIRTALAEDPSVQPPAAALRRRVSIPLVWLVPATLFDDAQWPGADRAARIATTVELLFNQGIALVTV